jgi:hypothetical protein
LILVQIAPDHLAREALQRVKEKTKDRWTPEYVSDCITGSYEGMRRASATLYSLRDPDHIAYIVVEVLRGYEVTLNIWIVEGSRGLRSVAEIVALFDDLARSVGATHWKWESPRKGWARHLRRFITSERKVYERKVP